MNANELTVHQLQGWCFKTGASVLFNPDGTIYGSDAETTPILTPLRALARMVAFEAIEQPADALEWPTIEACNLPEPQAAAPSAMNTQVGGSHYKSMAIQPMEYSMANNMDACQHTAIKYISRFRDKGGIGDLLKAKHVIDMLIEFEVKAGRGPVAANDNTSRAQANG